MLNYLKSEHTTKLSSYLCRRFPELRRLQAQWNIPELVRNCPPSLYDFVRKIQSTLLVDNEPFTFEGGHEYLIEPYKAVCAEGKVKEDGDEIVLMTGAQVGKTIMAQLAVVWMALWWWGKYFGYFFPDRELAMITSAVRFKPLCMSIPEIAPLWGEDPDGDDKTRKKKDAQRVRSIGPSQIFFGYMGGVSSTESLPLLGMVFDEVRRMLEAQVELATERMSHSPYPFNIKISTAKYPDTTIDRYFRRGTMNKFASRCKCPKGIVLVDHFPNCVGERTAGNPKYAHLPPYFWICPRCGEPVLNPRDGHWVEQNPGSKIKSYHIPQILSPRQTAGRIYQAFVEASDVTEFYNSKLGIPHVSSDAQIVNRDILKATVDKELKWKQEGRNCVLGLDQMLGFNVAVVRERGPLLPNGLYESRLVHLEWISNPKDLTFSPWPRCHELMKQYDVGYGVVDAMGGSAEHALAFALEYPGRVFLADYSYEAEDGADICVWGDKVANDPNRKASKDTKLKHRVMISRFHAIEWNLMRYVHRIKRQPHEKGLLGYVPDVKKEMQTVFICEQVFWDHLCKIARRQIEVKEHVTINGQKHIIDQGRRKQVFENMGLDPHFLHADLYAEIALTRLRGGDGGAFSSYRKAAEAKEAAKPTDHDFAATENPMHFKCKRAGCGLMVSKVEGLTLQQIADKVGSGECRGKK